MPPPGTECDVSRLLVTCCFSEANSSVCQSDGQERDGTRRHGLATVGQRRAVLEPPAQAAPHAAPPSPKEGQDGEGGRRRLTPSSFSPSPGPFPFQNFHLAHFLLLHEIS